VITNPYLFSQPFVFPLWNSLTFVIVLKATESEGTPTAMVPEYWEQKKVSELRHLAKKWCISEMREPEIAFGAWAQICTSGPNLVVRKIKIL